jgi:Transglutaminase-like superfamily
LGGFAWRRIGVFGAAVFAFSILTIAPYLTSSTEMVRLRNAALLIDGNGHTFDWTPASIPHDFVLESGLPDPVFSEAVKRLGLAEMNSDWERATAISRHLLSNPKLVGTPIQSNLRDTYRRILEDGTGYCGDFTRVFIALAIAAGVPVRAWAFSLDGYGGRGHIWPEIWNRQLNRWQLVDVFNNFYFRGSTEAAISASEFRRAMLTSPESISRVLLDAEARPGYEFEEKMWAWYRKGLPEWYMIWGNNVFSYDRSVMTRNLGRFSRSLEQFDAIVTGVYPPISLMAEDLNSEKASALRQLRLHLVFVAWVAPLALLVAIIGLIGYLQSRWHGKVSLSKRVISSDAS